MVGSIVSVQVGAAIAKDLFPLIGAREVTALRLTMATIILCLVHRPWRQRMTVAQLRFVAMYGASIGIMNFLFYMSLARIPLGVAVALEFTGPLTVALLSSRHAIDFVWAILAAAGIALLLPLTSFTAPIDPIGILYALGAGAFWAVYIVVGQRAGAMLSGGVVVSLGMVVGTIVALPLCVIGSAPFTPTPHILGMGILIGILSSALPYTLEMIALPRLPAKTFSIFMSAEPAVAAFLGFVLLHEQLAILQWVAIASVVVASVGSTITGTPAVIHD